MNKGHLFGGGWDEALRDGFDKCGPVGFDPKAGGHLTDTCL